MKKHINKNFIELRQILFDMKPKTTERINGGVVKKTKKGLFIITSEFPYKYRMMKLEHTVKILAGENYLIADPFCNQRRKIILTP